MKNIFKFSPPENNEFNIKAPKKAKEKKYNKADSISNSLSKNVEVIKELMHFPICSDLKLRFFDTIINEKNLNILITFYDGLIDSSILDNFIIKQFLTPQKTNKNLHDTILRLNNCRMSSN